METNLVLYQYQCGGGGGVEICKQNNPRTRQQIAQRNTPGTKINVAAYRRTFFANDGKRKKHGNPLGLKGSEYSTRGKTVHKASEITTWHVLYLFLLAIKLNLYNNGKFIAQWNKAEREEFARKLNDFTDQEEQN